MTGCVNNDSGMIGSARALRFGVEKRTKHQPPRRRSSDTTRSDAQPYCGAHVSASSSGTTAADQRGEAGPVEDCC